MSVEVQSLLTKAFIPLTTTSVYFNNRLIAAVMSRAIAAPTQGKKARI